MFRQSIIKQPSQSLPTSLSLQNIVVDLEPQHEESISGGSGGTDIPYIQADWFLSHASGPRFLTMISSYAWYELIYLPGLNRTRRIVGREQEEVV